VMYTLQKIVPCDCVSLQPEWGGVKLEVKQSRSGGNDG
jgi:hypothetical protein